MARFGSADNCSGSKYGPTAWPTLLRWSEDPLHAIGERRPCDSTQVFARADARDLQRFHNACRSVQQQIVNRRQFCIEAPLNPLQFQADQQGIGPGSSQEATHVVIGGFPPRNMAGELYPAKHEPNLSGTQGHHAIEGEHRVGKATGSRGPTAVHL